jgi:signal transduction histidine kinase
MYAVSALVPYPRLGGGVEQRIAKQWRKHHVASDSVESWISKISVVNEELSRKQREALQTQMHALHEVRSINQTIKATMERLCENSAHGDPENATPDLLRAWKASELISLHFDSLDLLTNPVLSEVRPRRTVIFYKIVDKITRIYRPQAEKHEVIVKLLGESYSSAVVDPSTIHIIPSVFISNAVKYSPRSRAVEIRVMEGFRDNRRTVGFEVASLGPSATGQESARMFRQKGRGMLASQKAQGSGVGLLIAKTVSDQHAGFISAKQDPSDHLGHSHWTFHFELPIG